MATLSLRVSLVIPALNEARNLPHGFAACRGDIIVMLDADGSTSPAEIPRFVDALVAGADFAKGSRFVEGGGSSDITRLRRTGNHLLSGAVNALYGTDYTDLCPGYTPSWPSSLRVPGMSPAPPL